MIVQMRKFGAVLNSRPAGREALLAISPTLPSPSTAGSENQPVLGIPDLRAAEGIELDFAEVEVLTPSFAEEFVVGLLEKYPRRVSFRHTDNVTVKTTLNFLARQWPELMGSLSYS